MSKSFKFLGGASALATLILVGCASQPEPPAKGGNEGSKKEGDKAPSGEANAVNVDGSNTVFPITSGLQEMATGGAKITVAHAGTGAGFQKFINGEIDICDASRVIKKEEDAKLKEKGIEYYEVAIAYDGLCIVVNAKNKLSSITTAELKTLWNKDSKAKTWKDVNPAWPATPINLYGPTTDHGTYEYFNEAINGDKANSRADYSQQADYDALITNVSRDENAMAYVGFSFAALKPDQVKVLTVDGGAGPIAPTEKTIMDGSYKPLSRPLLIYVNKKAYDSKPAVKAFVDSAFDPKTVVTVVKQSKYVPLPDDAYAAGAKLIAAGKTGSHLMDAKPGTSYADLVSAATKA